MPTTYRIDNITDVQLPYYTSMTYMQYNVTYVGPVQEHVSLSLSGLPAGISTDTDSHAGIPSFTAAFQLMNDGTAKPGNYTITLNCVGDKTGAKSYTFKLKVLPPPQCSSTVVGTWVHNLDCSGFSYSDNVTTDPAGVPNRIIFTNFAGGGAAVYADLNCNTGVLTIPSQTYGSHTFYGNGYFYSGYMSISYTDVSPAGTVSCNITMQP